jgi:hypothetical protein
MLFAEWLDMHILKLASHAPFIFTIAKLLRPIFKCTLRNSAGAGWTEAIGRQAFVCSYAFLST